jgi:hypothetical protein
MKSRSDFVKSGQPLEKEINVNFGSIGEDQFSNPLFT